MHNALALSVFVSDFFFCCVGKTLKFYSSKNQTKCNQNLKSTLTDDYESFKNHFQIIFETVNKPSNNNTTQTRLSLVRMSFFFNTLSRASLRKSTGRQESGLILSAETAVMEQKQAVLPPNPSYCSFLAR